ncbi:MAG TPA: type II secretion system F family protein [Candidatus Acidoferrales bacterium]|jgi:type IV pilus assembly protein PilC|nr:type II secretion system F family protein [Candidatus Acidoferrales bacterium]
MADFVCKVGDASGRIFQQVETAQSEDEARRRLAERGFYVFSVRNQFDLLAQFGRASRDRKIRPADFLIFNQQFNTLVRAGLPILRALDLLADRAGAARLRPILEDVRQRVRAGALLSEAMAAQGSFSPVYVTVIAAGERSGNLTGVLDQYISYLRVTTGFRSRLITALIYPAVLVAVAIIVVTYLATYALPQFAGLYQELNVPLPTSTRILLSIALPLRNYFIFLVIALVVGSAALFLWTRSDRGAIAIDRFKPRIPVFGDIWIKAQIAQFVRTLSTLLAGGTPLVPALRTSAAAIGTRLIAASVEQASERVKEGQTLHSSLAETKLVPGMALEMIEVGEASGALAAMLTSVAEFYEEEVDTRLQRTLSWIPIGILVVMAVVIGFILISLYLPMFSLQIGSLGG